MKPARRAVFLFLALCSTAQAAPEPVGDPVRFRALQSVVFLTARETPQPGQTSWSGPPRTSWATAFFVSATGLALTSRHVVCSVEGGRVVLQATLDSGGTGRQVPARVVAQDEDADLALLQVQLPPGHQVRALPLSANAPDLLDAVLVFSFPNGLLAATNRLRGPEPAVTRGEVAALRHDDQGRLMRLDTTAAASPGSSGGPLVNAKGEVVGILWGSLDPYGKIVSAVAAERAQALLPKAEAPSTASPSPVGRQLAASTALAGVATNASPVADRPAPSVPGAVVCLVVLTVALSAIAVARCRTRYRIHRRQVDQMTARLLGLLLVAWLAPLLTGCSDGDNTPTVALDELLRYPDRHYLSPVRVSGETALPLQSGRSPDAGTYRLAGPGQGIEVLVRSAQLPPPGLSVLVEALVTIDPATSSPELVETSRQEGRTVAR
jgi:S1-C subfamily serine protease